MRWERFIIRDMQGKPYWFAMLLFWGTTLFLIGWVIRLAWVAFSA